MQLSPLQSENLANSLKRHIAGEVLTDDYRRALYSTDASLYQIQPLAVVIPKSREDVAACVAIAAEHHVPLVARGSGTSLSGQSIGAGIVVDFSKYLNKIVDLDAGARTARVEPGVVLDQLNAAAAQHGLQFGPDVATSNRANIGGMIGNNSAGSRSIRHGKTVDNVLELSVLAADATPAMLRPLTAEQLLAEQARGNRWGDIYRAVERIVAAEHEEIIARFPPILRRVSGYNLDEFVPECRDRFPVPPNVALNRRSEAQRFPGANFNLSKLIVGAEGTLACVTEAVVHLVPLPARRGVIVLHFDSLVASVAAVGAVLSCRPSAAELLDGQIIRLAEKSLEYKHYLDFVVGKPESLMLVEFSGETDEEIRRSADELAERVRGLPGLFHTLEALDRERCNHIWACRKASLPLLYGVPGLRKPIAFVEDTAVDPSRLVEFVARFREIIARAGTVGAFYGHASVGCLHIRPMLDAADRGDRALIARISSEVCGLVIEFQGAMSGEHGDGLARSYLNERLFGPRLYAAFKQVKAAFDPAGILNPGKVVDGPGPLENLRQGNGYRPQEITTTFDFGREGGFLRAAEMCNGSGVCRKRATGTMCPSFMATGDEEHSTRGRANALRLVLSGALPPGELTGRKLYDTFDLCLQCKGCKAECPSNVDVAKLKAEFLHKYHAEHGVPLGARMMADRGAVESLGIGAGATIKLGTVELVAKCAGGREAVAAIRRDRCAAAVAALRAESLSPLVPPPHKIVKHVVGRCPKRGPIVLLDDCLTSYCEPRVNRAAVAVLEAAGYEVHLAGLECCGRAAISKGLLDEARHLAQRNIARLLPWAERGVPIVGCEPSCLLTFVDDYLDLIPGEDSRRIAAAASLIETHLVRSNALPTKGTRVKKNDSRPLLLHGHCHQKALIGMTDTIALLTNIHGAAPTLIDSGCCGMAGSFGYEHYDLSMKIGERVLFPAVRTSTDATIAAPGFSCRHQIEHGTGRRAIHPIELIAEML